jgi:hypothetical protein
MGMPSATRWNPCGIRITADAAQTTTGTPAGSNAAAQSGFGETYQTWCGLVARHLGAIVIEQTAASQESKNAATDREQKPLDLVVGRWRQPTERARISTRISTRISCLDENTVGHQGMEVDVYVESGATALDCRHGTAFWIAQTKAFCPTPLHAQQSPMEHRQDRST